MKLFRSKNLIFTFVCSMALCLVGNTANELHANSGKTLADNPRFQKKGNTKKPKYGDRFPPEKWGKVGKDMILDLNGNVPSDNDIRSAIVGGLNHILGEQKPNGSWDLVLKGKTVLGQTADHAIDAVMITALCGVALRRHTDLMPSRIDSACRRAAEFIMAQIFRGQLPTGVDYAVWRYTMGLRFLAEEYKRVQKKRGDEWEEYRDDLDLTALRMTQTLIQIQYVNGKPRSFSSKRYFSGLSSKQRAVARPAQLGIVVDLPTDTNFRGGVTVTKVIPGSPAAKYLEVNDKIYKMNNMRIENAYDYYTEETRIFGTQKVKVEYERIVKGKKKRKSQYIYIEPKWPGTLGFDVEETTQGVKILDFKLNNSLKASGSTRILKGDVITHINKAKITSKDQYDAIMDRLLTGEKVRVSWLHKKEGATVASKKATTLLTVPVPRGRVQVGLEEEDKSREYGVLITHPGTLQQYGVQQGDRLTHIGHTPILGIDHFNLLLTTLPSNVKIKMIVRRSAKGQASQDHLLEFKAEEIIKGSQLDIGWANVHTEAVIGAVHKGGVADIAGFKKGDKIIEVHHNGKPVIYLSNRLMYYHPEKFKKANPKYSYNKNMVGDILSNFMAGTPMDFVVIRGEERLKFHVEKLAELSDQGNVFDEGGWAYYRKNGESISFVTGATLLTIEQATIIPSVRRVFTTGQTGKDSIRAAVNSLHAMNHVDNGNNTKVKGYVYRHTTASSSDMRGMMGRISVCELALYRRKHKEHDQQKLHDVIKLWHDNRNQLDIVRMFKHTHHYDHYANAAYYWLFGHYYTAMATNDLKDKAFAKKVQDTILKAMMKTRLPNGTWMGHESFGDLTGTAEAMLVFGEIDRSFRRLANK